MGSKTPTSDTPPPRPKTIEEAYDWARYNKRELMALLLRRGFRVKQELPTERMIELITTFGEPDENEITAIHQSRAKLEVHIRERFGKSYSQLPCRGAPTQAQCTKHSCSDARHLLCYLENEAKIV